MTKAFQWRRGTKNYMTLHDWKRYPKKIMILKTLPKHPGYAPDAI